MGRFEHTFPFSAVAGQYEVKKALLLCAVNPRIGGVLLSGDKGTAKSTLVRGISRLVGNAPFVELPLNITADRLVGSLDMEQAVRDGVLTHQDGLLHGADGGFLYADEVNLLPEHIVNILLDVSASGVNRIEREGLSIRQDACIVLVGSMNPEEGLLRPQFLDRFGLYVPVTGAKDPALRCEIMRRRLAYEADPAAFCRKWREADKLVARQIQGARDTLTGVTVSRELCRLAGGIAAEGGCAGHRAEIVLCQTAMAAAALRGSDQVTEEDIRGAAPLVLPHRLREKVCLDSPSQPEDHSPEPCNPDRPPEEIPPADCPPPEQPLEQAGEAGEGKEPQEDWQDIVSASRDIPLTIRPDEKAACPGTGKRLKVRSGAGKGRYVRYRIPGERFRDIALDATLRAASMHGRGENGLMVNVRREDIREKVRESRTGAAILFLVDASGSMGARRRMGAVKGAVLSMLTDAYRKRDNVGIVTFRKHRAESVLNFTRSVDLAEKSLRDIRTGGKTPLEAGLRKTAELFRTDRIKQKEALQYLVVVSDGRANVSSGTDPLEDALDVARSLRADGIHALILDTQSGYMRFDCAERLSDALGGEYVRLQDITGGEIEQQIKKHFS